MRNTWSTIRIYLLGMLSFLPLKSYAQQAYVSDEDISGIFVSGGYGALFGAAMGAAILPFMNSSPMQNIRLVAGGASIGFMVGSAYGFYSLANARRTSYFNYNNNQEDDDNNTYYSMPATMPTHGYNKRKKENKPDTVEEVKAPLIGALFMSDGKKLDYAFPYFWVDDKKVSILLAYVTF